MRGLPQDAERLHGRLKKLADESSQIKSLWIFDRLGHALVNSLDYPAPAIDFSDRDYFGAHAARDVGTYVGEVLRPRPPYGGAPFFGVSRRRTSPDGSFNGVIQASILPEYFEGFLRENRARARQLLLFDSRGRTHTCPFSQAPTRCTAGSAGRAAQSNANQGGRGNPVPRLLIDGMERTVSYLKLPNLPVYVVAGRDAAAVRAEWLAQVRGHLLFGLPSTTALILSSASRFGEHDACMTRHIEGKPLRMP